MAGSDYSLRLRATLDTTQVQQELKKLRAAQAMVLDQGGAGINKGLPGMAHVQKIEVQLTKLNSSIAGLQHAIEQLSRAQQHPTSANVPQHAGTFQYLPVGMKPADIRRWMESSKYISFNHQANALLRKQGSVLGNRAYYKGLVYRIGGASNAARLFESGSLEQLAPSLAQAYENQMNRFRSKSNTPSQRAAIRQGRQFAGLIGGQLLGGVGSYATDFGYTRTGAVASGLGSGVTAGGGAALGASMLGAGASAATGVGIVVGIVTAAAAITKAFMELEESAKKAAEAQANIAETLRSNAVGQSLDMYGMWQKQRAEEVQKQNNFPVAKERAEYFKTQLEKARSQFYLVGDPAEYEKKIREEAEKKKNATVDDFYVQGSMQSGFTEVHFQRKRTDEEKAAIDKAANEAIEAQQKKFAAAKRELLAAEANAQVWQDVADKLKESKEAGEKLARARRQEEAVERNALVRQSSELKYAFRDEDSLRSTQIFANDILREKNGPLSAFNKLSEELDNLRAQRKDLRTQAFGINRDMELNGRSKTSIELKDMARQRDDLLHRAKVLGQRADILETALGNIDVSKLAHNPDLSHITSLAQYGFNMGEKNDTVERMDRYYTKSITLQQQIRDKIEQGIKTEAIYN